jgi:hypothetical protein
MTEEDNDIERLKQASENLGVHFDTVQILATRHIPGEDEGTINVSYGVGNWCARYGQTKEWLIRCDARTKKYVEEEEED